MTFGEAAARLEAVLRGSTRREILDAAGTGDDAVARLRRSMRAHAFPAAGGTVSLRGLVDSLDARTRNEGLHVLQGWDFTAHRFSDDIAPVLLLDYCERNGVLARADRRGLAILLDQYFLALLSLLAVRAWDDGEANANLDRVTALLGDLHGADGSGFRIANDAETLLMLAVAYYHPDEPAYELVLLRVHALDDPHRLRFALSCASVMASHLRWGFRFMYRRDAGLMRNDNVVDYPLLLFAMLTVARAFSAKPADTPLDRVAGALMDGLSPDPWAFTGKAPAFLAPVLSEHDELRAFLSGRKTELLAEFERLQPAAGRYSPLAFGCNFLSNASVASVVLALGGAHHPSINALFVRGESGGAAECFARDLMNYSAAPERLGAGGAPLIVFDQYEGIGSYNTLIRTLRA